MTTNPVSAISTVSTNGASAPKARMGRPALVLKGGKPYAEARDEANAAIRSAKDALKGELAKLKDSEKVVVATTKARDGLVKDFNKVKPLTDAKAEKARLKEHAQFLKNAEAQIKLVTKLRDTQAKAVTKAQAGVEKATSALAKVEEAKAAILAAKAPKQAAAN